MEDRGLSLQERLAPQGRCFGCGPANGQGLRIRSFALSEDPDSALVCEWTPLDYHAAFEDVLNGGIVGTLLDCHSNWTALHHLWRREGSGETPSTVTYDFHVKLKAPTPMGQSLKLVAEPVESDGKWVTVESRIEAGDLVTATCRGRFVKVGPGHPAYQRW
ncbi:MAG: PaaI family thioesterase [Thermoanaerobaculia bacterium]|nr:PaaI family thioesterase [Thermoanaerobaculia bacterium]